MIKKGKWKMMSLTKQISYIGLPRVRYPGNQKGRRSLCQMRKRRPGPMELYMWHGRYEDA
jgi:hypothetical protein